MQDRGWSISLGRWGPVEIRLHATLLVFAAMTLYLAARTSSAASVNLASVSLALLFISLLLHELGHCLSAWQLGGDARQIVLVPWGGLTSVVFSRQPRSELLVSLAGPVVNAAICGLCLPFLVLLGEAETLPKILDPLHPEMLFGDRFTGPSGAQVVLIVFWINWVLLLANLIPAYPFDGGRVARALLASSYPGVDRRVTAVFVARMAKVVAIVFAMVAAIAWFTQKPGEAIIPLWFAIALLSLVLFFSAQQEEERAAAEAADLAIPFGENFPESEAGYEHSPTVGAPTSSGLLTRWLERRRETRLRQQREIELDEEQRLDEILQRLHAQGMQHLSVEDRSLLERVSARMRTRRDNTAS